LEERYPRRQCTLALPRVNSDVVGALLTDSSSSSRVDWGYWTQAGRGAVLAAQWEWGVGCAEGGRALSWGMRITGVSDESSGPPLCAG